MSQQNINVFPGRDTPEEDDLAIGRQFFREFFHVAFQRPATTRVALIDIDLGKSAQIVETDRRHGWHEPAIRRDDENAGQLRLRLRERIRVGQFPAEIKTAQKGENFSKRRAVLTPQAPRQIELRPFVHDHSGALASGVRGRKKENAVHQPFLRRSTFRPCQLSTLLLARWRFACNSGKCFSDQRQRIRSGSISVRPRRGSEYSTFGGATGLTLRRTSPSRSRLRRVCVSIFCEMPPIVRWSEA